MAEAGIGISYSNIRRIVAEDAVTEQHDTTLTMADGQSVTVEACVVFRFKRR